jgi:polyferredoxin
MGRRRGAPFVRARVALQLAFLALVVAIGAQFTAWAFAHLGGRAPVVPRPAGVEGFLPISALMSLRLGLAGGGVHPVHPAALAILLAILAMSAVLAKSFCSHLCPVGALSEWLGRLGARLLGRTWQPPRWLDVPLRSLKYLLLAFFVWATWVAMDVAAVRAFLDSPYNRVADLKMLLFFARPSRTTLAVLGVLVVGSLLVRDLWCRYLCPYGALLGPLGRLAPLKVTRDVATCTDCKLCTRVCPARLPVHAMTRVASVECTSCLDCVAACPVRDCLAVRPPRRPAAVLLRPAAAVAVALAVYLAVTTSFRLAGSWHGSVGESEYAARAREIDSPLYTHVGGMAGPETPVRDGLQVSHEQRRR